MKKYPDFQSAIKGTIDKLLAFGREVDQKNWQSKPSPDNTHELLNESFQVMSIDRDTFTGQIKPTLPWADLHFEERVGEKPLNPPPSHEKWPFSSKNNSEFVDSSGEFDHTYPERFWPKYAGDGFYRGGKEMVNMGIRFRYGDLNDVLKLLGRDPTTRQAYLPIWFPEDTGSAEGQRVPCTLGYHFIQRFGYLHVVYYIRSCDVVRHFRNDVYFTAKLLLWVLDELNEFAVWEAWKPGTFTMHITSLHCFMKEKHLLKSNF
jgi:hypothetical protein